MTPAWTRVAVTRTHLEMRSLQELLPAKAPRLQVEMTKRHPISPAEYRAIYSLVGERWLWRDRLTWSDAEMEAYLASPSVHVWTPLVANEIAGYFELRMHGDRATVELMYFGLAPAFIGRGLGGWLLARAVEEAFGLGARRLILNTCTLDAPQALPNYLARGFTIVREEQYLLDVPASPPAKPLLPDLAPAYSRN
jgi:GNAT superfamily N-acetyltransferase